MKLKISSTMQNLIVRVEIEAIDFTDQEMLMLNQLGEPIIRIDKNYGLHHVKFEKRIRKGFKAKQEFDARLDSPKEVVKHMDDFLEDVKIKLEEEMIKIKEAYEVELKPRKQTIEIEY